MLLFTSTIFAFVFSETNEIGQNNIIIKNSHTDLVWSKKKLPLLNSHLHWLKLQLILASNSRTEDGRWGFKNVDFLGFYNNEYFHSYTCTPYRLAVVKIIWIFQIILVHSLAYTCVQFDTHSLYRPQVFPDMKSIIIDDDKNKKRAQPIWTQTQRFQIRVTLNNFKRDKLCVSVYNVWGMHINSGTCANFSVSFLLLWYTLNTWAWNNHNESEKEGVRHGIECFLYLKNMY